MVTAKKVKATRTVKKSPSTSSLYIEKSTYKELIAGLMDQGLEHADAVETLKVGLRQANGLPMPPGLIPVAHAELSA